MAFDSEKVGWMAKSNTCLLETLRPVGRYSYTIMIHNSQADEVGWMHRGNCPSKTQIINN